MWGLTPARLGILAAAALTAFAAGGLATWLLVASPRIELAEQKARADVATLTADVERARADGEKAGREAQATLNQKAQEAADERVKDYQAIAERADRGAALTLRLCNPRPAPGAAASGGPAGPAAGHDVPAGVLAGADGGDPGAVLRAQLVQYAADAERMSADLRAVVKAAGGKP